MYEMLGTRSLMAPVITHCSLLHPMTSKKGGSHFEFFSPGVSPIFSLCAKVFRGVFRFHLRALGFITNCCSCVAVNPSDTFYVILSYAKKKKKDSSAIFAETKQNILAVAEVLK